MFIFIKIVFKFEHKNTFFYENILQTYIKKDLYNGFVALNLINAPLFFCNKLNNISL